MVVITSSTKVILILALVLLCFTVYSGRPRIPCTSLVDTSIQDKRIPRTVFYDFGVNSGSNIKMVFGLLKPEKDFENGLAVEGEACAKCGGCIIYGFEANPSWNERLQDLAKEILELNNKNKDNPCWKPVDIKMFTETAIWINDTTLTFHGEKDSVGASAIWATHQPMHIVKAVNITRFIEETCDPSDYCVMKMDVEGSEFVLMKALIKSGMVARLDKLFVEWHAQYMPGDQALYKQYQTTMAWLLDTVFWS